jgi:hypothetical protein
MKKTQKRRACRARKLGHNSSWKISAHVDGGLSRGYRVRYPGARTPIGVSGNFNLFFLLLLGPPLFKTTEGVVVGFQIFAWAPKKK